MGGGWGGEGGAGVANQFRIGKASAHQILHEKLGLSKVPSKHSL